VRYFPAICWPANKDMNTSRYKASNSSCCEADSDELRSQRDEAAADLRERHHWQNARKPKMHFRQ
jgi:hypothetical protein